MITNHQKVICRVYTSSLTSPPGYPHIITHPQGANWVPPDSFEARVTSTVLCDLLQSVRDANMNFLRIWGGGIFPQNAFFDCADRLGILVEQDFIFSDAVYPTTPQFLDLITKEVVTKHNSDSM